LSDDIAAIEDAAKQPKADAGRVKRMIVRLWDAMKAVGVPILVDVGTALAKVRLGLPQ
jgi:hypothetical protein